MLQHGTNTCSLFWRQAHKSTSDEIGILRKVFEKYAVDGDGVIEFSEFAKAMESTGISRSHLKTIYDGVVSCILNIDLCVNG